MTGLPALEGGDLDMGFDLMGGIGEINLNAIKKKSLYSEKGEFADYNFQSIFTSNWDCIVSKMEINGEHTDTFTCAAVNKLKGEVPSRYAKFEHIKFVFDHIHDIDNGGNTVDNAQVWHYSADSTLKSEKNLQGFLAQKLHTKLNVFACYELLANWTTQERLCNKY